MINRQMLRETANIGLIAGSVTLSASMIGIVETFNQRDVISGVFSLGQLILFVGAIVAGYLVGVQQKAKGGTAVLLNGLLAGLLSGVPLFGLIWLTLIWENIRNAFINVSPGLVSIITLGSESAISGGLLLIAAFGVLGIAGAAFSLVPASARRAIMIGLVWTVGLGVMSEILIGILRPRLTRETLRLLFGSSGLEWQTFVALASIITIVSFWWNRGMWQRYKQVQTNLTPSQKALWRRISIGLLVIFVLVLPSLLGIYLSEIINNVALYVLMGLGLNIAIGMAGLLDLGYVTNFAVGAYVMALLTSTSSFGLSDPISFWMALPISVAAAMFTGFFFALPVLKMRGDYLAIATLGFGEIVRILARSDAMKEMIGGAQGILQVPQARISGIVGEVLTAVLDPLNAFLGRFFGLSILSSNNGEIVFGTPPQLYYLLVLCCLLMLFVSQRLNNSRTGRRWMAIREDEDVAAAMGINTTSAKVLAFTLSAASGGLAGAVFAAKLGSIFPHSFQLLISINVLSLIIVGGLASIPGVIVGALALVGIPELLREFAEFRLLLYGMALIIMMLVRPEGLWPSEIRKRELYGGDSPETAVQPGGD